MANKSTKQRNKIRLKSLRKNVTAVVMQVPTFNFHSSRALRDQTYSFCKGDGVVSKNTRRNTQMKVYSNPGDTSTAHEPIKREDSMRFKNHGYMEYKQTYQRAWLNCNNWLVYLYMKQVVLTIPSTQPLVLTSDATTEKYYGAAHRANNQRSFITRPDYFSQKGYRLACVGKVTQGNYYDAFDADTVSGILENVLKNGNFNIYEFDTPQELFRWLSEGN